MQNRRRTSSISFFDILAGFLNSMRDLLLVLSVISLFGFLQWAIETYIGK